MTNQSYANCVKIYQDAFVFEKRDLTIEDMVFASLYEKRGSKPLTKVREFSLVELSEMFD